MLILNALSCTVFIGRVVQRKIWGGKIKEPKIWAVHRGGAMWGVCVGVGESGASGRAARGIHLRARVRCEIFLTDMRAVDMCVDLSRRDIGVAEHLLDSSQIGPALEEMSRKRMA